MPTEFSAPYDSTAKLITVVAGGLLVSVAAAIHHPLAFLSILIIGLAYAYSPRRFRVANGTISIHRLIGSLKIPLAEVQELRQATPDDLQGTLRLFGSGGMFGYFGLFRTSKLGRCSWYVTDRSRAVVIVSSPRPILISPNDPAQFIAACGLPTPSPSSAAPPPARSTALRSPAAWLGLAIGAASVVLAAAAFLYAPGPPPLTLTADTLDVHDRFYPVTLHPADVDLDHARIIDLQTDPDWRPTLRTNGFANSHYRSGWFRTANGQTIRLYRAESTRLVLLPPKSAGPTVLLEVPDPAAFLTHLHHQWTQPR